MPAALALPWLLLQPLLLPFQGDCNSGLAAAGLATLLL
jgi:hypothetical protein